MADNKKRNQVVTTGISERQKWLRLYNYLELPPVYGVFVSGSGGQGSGQGRAL